MIEWVNHINKAYINLTAPLIKVFKLDKTATKTDTLYNEEKSSRIYLPPFEMRAFHLDNAWQQTLGIYATEEKEETMQFGTNFEDMVQRIRDLKNSHITDMYITYAGTGTPSASNDGTDFIIKVNGSIIKSFDLTNHVYNTTLKLGTNINLIEDFTVTIYGKNDVSIALENFAETSFKTQTLEVFTLDATYANITDVIENGDAILTNKWRLYEVANAMPFGDFGWDYTMWRLDGTLAKLDQMDLPANYQDEIEEHQYGIKDKISLE